MGSIYIDVTRLLSWNGNYTGMERFAFEISQELANQDSTDIQFCCFATGQGFVAIGDAYKIEANRLTSPLFGPSPALRELIKTNKLAFLKHYIKRQNKRRKQSRLKPIQLGSSDTLLIYDGLWDQQEYIDAILKSINSKAKLAHVVCDIIPLVMPEVCLGFVTEAMRSYFDQIAPHIDVLLSISKNTQKDIERLYGFKLKPSIEKYVIRFGDNIGGRAKAQRPDNLPIKAGEYLLCVGTIEIRKNHQLLYEAYRLAVDKNIELPKLVIVGREGWMAEQTTQALKNDPAVKDKMVFAGPINDSQLNWLYANCMFTVFPSLYEGWGLPVAESLYHGKVCAASSASSVPEVGGGLNKYFSPHDTKECLKVISDLTRDDERHKLEAAIAKNYKPTLWSQTAADVIECLK